MLAFASVHWFHSLVLISMYVTFQSLFSKVKDSVKDMLSPSWLSDLVTNVKKDSPPQSSDQGQPKEKDAFMVSNTFECVIFCIRLLSSILKEELI